MEKPLSVWEALMQEHQHLGGDEPKGYAAALDAYKTAWQKWADAGKPDYGATWIAYDAAQKELRRVVVGALGEAKRSALCFSGGGIRSATFGLGVLQGLAKRSSSREDGAYNLLGEIDYLSTVSGGGYLGSWFSSWVCRAGAEPDNKPADRTRGVTHVISELSTPPKELFDPEPKPLRHLRAFSNYLNPKLGFTSADTWTLVATVIRNLLLNWLVLLPLLAAALILPRVFLRLVQWSPTLPNLDTWIVAAGLVLGIVSIAYMVTDLPSAGDGRQSQARFNIFSISTMLGSSICFALFWAWGGACRAYHLKEFILFSMAYMLVGLAAGGIAVMVLKKPHLHWKSAAVYIGGGLLAAALTGVFAGWLGYNIGEAFLSPATRAIYNDKLYAALAVPALISILFLGQTVLVGLTSDITSDPDREWWARAGAWYLIVILFWAAFGSVAIFGHDAYLWLQALATGLTGWAASQLGLSPRTSAGRQEEKDKKLPSLPLPKLSAELIANILMLAFIVLLTILLASVDEAWSHQIGLWAAAPPPWAFWAPIRNFNPTWAELLLLCGLTIVGLAAGFFVDVNKFSLHAMYRSRLIRAYLGASNERRHPHLFTGFDENDNVRMCDLRNQRPFHVVNMALNLVKGENLAWQQRKAETFTATPLHVGSCRLAYQDSALYGRKGGMTLGGAITISGAAASPNMGYHSSPLLTMIMALFNARLGAWLANPGPPGRGVWDSEGPTFGIRSYSDEVFGQTDDENAWVYLSDGGHFENLGIYEMVLRRCQTIIAVDGGADGKFEFEDLGNAVRKIRVDLGIPIDFDRSLPLAENGRSHAAIGKIHYKVVDEQAHDGTIIYIKPTLCGREPTDVANYKAQNKDFPHQPTLDQWFDEAQFESYRQLGLHVIDDIYTGAGVNTKENLTQFSDRAAKYAGISGTGPGNGPALIQ